METIRLGDNFASAKLGSCQLPEQLADKQFLLAVGTIEPRKNYQQLLDTFDSLQEKHPKLCLVIAGKKGWSVDATIERITSHPRFGGTLFWFENLNDDCLHALYKKAYAYIITSLYEGYGLPLSEALSLGCVSISSDAASLPESGGTYADYYAANDSAQLTGVIDHLINNPAEYQARKKSLEHRNLNTWQATALQISDILTREFGGSSVAADIDDAPG